VTGGFLSIDDEALADDDRDLPGANVRDYELGDWWQRQHGRRASYSELQALRRRRALAGRRRVLRWRAAGLSDSQIADAIVRDLLSSPEALAGAAVVGAGLTALREGVLLGLQLSDWAGTAPWPRSARELAPSPRPVVVAAHEYASAKLRGGPVPPSAALVPRDVIAALNSTDREGLLGWRHLLGERRRGSNNAMRSALRELAAAGYKARQEHPAVSLDQPEPGPPRGLRPLRRERGGESAWAEVLDHAAAAEVSPALKPR
jgi:hypothetical protein